MVHALWQLPAASSGIEDPEFTMLKGRQCALVVKCPEEGDLFQFTLLFDGVEAFRVTYLDSRSEAMLEAYDQLIDAGNSAWLAEIRDRLERQGHGIEGLRHLMIDFDDGPCYELLCRSFEIDRRLLRAASGSERRHPPRVLRAPAIIPQRTKTDEGSE